METKELKEEETSFLTSKQESKIKLGREHEAIFRFHASERDALFSLLKEAKFYNIRIAEIEGGDFLLAYCKYLGDIRELDREILKLKGRALLAIGERKDGGIFDFFVSFADIGPSKFPISHKYKQRRYFLIFLPVLLLIGVLFGWKTLLPKIISAVEVKNSIRLEKPITYPSWNRFVFHEFQPAWLKIKRDYNMDDQEMIRLFKLIKDIPRYRISPGQQLNDLTIYPEIIDRALGLIVLKNVKGLKELEELFHYLEIKFIYAQSFPDEKAGKHLNMLDGRQFENLVILTFYEDVLLPNEDFTNMLITKIRTAYLVR